MSKYYQHSSKPALQAIEDFNAGIFNPNSNKWRIGQQQEYNRVYDKLREGYTIIFSDLLK